MPRTKFPTTFIYGLVDPTTNEIKYVGKADCPKERLSDHIKERGYYTSHKNHWLRKLVRAGNHPKLIILEEVSYIDWQEAEQWWISYFKFLGANLTNGTKGGDGVVPVEHVRKKMSNAKTGKTWGNHSEESKKKISLANSGRKHTVEARQKMSKAKTGKTFSDEYKRKLSDQRKGRSVSEETKRKIAGTLSGRKRPKEVVEKMSNSLKEYYRRQRNATI